MHIATFRRNGLHQQNNASNHSHHYITVNWKCIKFAYVQENTWEFIFNLNKYKKSCLLKHLSERSRMCGSIGSLSKRPVWARLHRGTSCQCLVGYPRAKGCVHVFTIKLLKTNIFRRSSLNVYCIYVTHKLDKHTVLTVRVCT